MIIICFCFIISKLVYTFFVELLHFSFFACWQLGATRGQHWLHALHVRCVRDIKTSFKEMFPAIWGHGRCGVRLALP